MSSFSPVEKRLYSRQTMVFGEEGQKKLKDARVLIIGMGGLGCPAALYLASSGIGHLKLVDNDTVDLSNLQRQIAYRVTDLNQPKVTRVREQLVQRNPHIDVQVKQKRLHAENILPLIEDVDWVLDCTDNFASRYMIHDACYFSNTKLIQASVYQWDGVITAFDAKASPCYRCLYPKPPDPTVLGNCADMGVIGVVPGILGTMQAFEVIRWITSGESALVGRLKLFDGQRHVWSEMKYGKDPDCILCGPYPGITHLQQPVESMVCDSIKSVTANALASLGSDLIKVDVREPYEIEDHPIKNSLKMPLSRKESWDLKPLKTEAAKVFICGSGSRSSMAIDYLKDKGIPNMYSLRGGLS